jgi:hypothetical protein
MSVAFHHVSDPSARLTTSENEEGTRMSVVSGDFEIQSVDEDERALLDAVGDQGTARIAEVVRQASTRRSPARVRRAYWELVTRGVLIPDAGGSVRLVPHA